MKTSIKVIIASASLLVCATAGYFVYAKVTEISPRSICLKLQSEALVTHCAEGTIDILRDLPRHKTQWTFLPTGGLISGVVIQFENTDDKKHAENIISDSNSDKAEQIDTIMKVFRDSLPTTVYGLAAYKDGDKKAEKVDEEIFMTKSKICSVYELPENILAITPKFGNDPIQKRLTQIYGYPIP